jgi:hypothetical protein
VIQSERIGCTYSDADKDHLDVAEHLRDAEENVQKDRHELGETGVVKLSEPTQVINKNVWVTCRQEGGTRSSSSGCRTPAGLRVRESDQAKR